MQKNNRKASRHPTGIKDEGKGLETNITYAASHVSEQTWQLPCCFVRAVPSPQRVLHALSTPTGVSPSGDLVQEMQPCWFSWCLCARQQSVSAGHLSIWFPSLWYFWDTILASRAIGKEWELTLPCRLKHETFNFHFGVYQSRHTKSALIS